MKKLITIEKNANDNLFMQIFASTEKLSISTEESVTAGQRDHLVLQYLDNIYKPSFSINERIYQHWETIH